MSVIACFPSIERDNAATWDSISLRELRYLMPSRFPLLSIFLLLFASALCDAQTATCTNWKFFSVGKSTTDPQGINRWGTVVGNGRNAGSTTGFGFVRYSNGNVQKYSGMGFQRRNAQGVTVGWGGQSQPQGLVLSGSSVGTVDYPNGGVTATGFLGINYWGTIVGIWSDTNPPFTGPWHSFKLKNGVFTTISYPGSSITNVTSISDKGVIVGYYNYYSFNGHHYPNHGFTLANGVYKTLDNPKASLAANNGTVLNDINSSGTIVGTYRPSDNLDHGFIYINGIFKDVKVPNFPASRVNGINGYGDITGIAYGSGSVTAYTAHCQ
jgi:hypothetical protein